MADEMKLGLWLAEKRHLPWQRGINDCCTLVMEWHDHLHGTDTLSEIKGKYWDLKTAIKWAKKIPLQEWFPKHGYKQIFDALETGDIVMVQHYKYFCSGYIICMGQAWGIQDDSKGLSRHALETMHEHTIWRYTDGI